MPQLRVLVGFGRMADSAVEDTAGSVSLNLYGNPAYPDPPVAKAALDAANAAYSTAVAAALRGSPADTADKNSKRAALIALLRQLAGYVQSAHGNDLALLLSSGFRAVSTNRSQSPLDTPNIQGILNGRSGQLRPRIKPIANARGYEVRFAAVAADGSVGPWQDFGIFPSTRALAVDGLTPGAVYAIQVRAVGGSTRYSDWSDPVQHRSM